MNSANQPISQSNQSTPNNQMNPNNQEIKPAHYFFKPVELPSESNKPIAPAEKVVCMYDSSSEYSDYSSCSEWSDSTEDLIDMLDEQPDHLWDLSSDSDY